MTCMRKQVSSELKCRDVWLCVQSSSLEGASPVTGGTWVLPCVWRHGVPWEEHCVPGQETGTLLL